MKNILLILLIAFSAAIYGAEPPRRQGVPATPYPIEISQPDGSTVIIRLFGDERMSYRVTLDGYVVVENRRGAICYAKMNCAGKIVPSRRIAHNEGERGEKELRYLERMRHNPKLYRGPVQ
jgi:hypothetical protein